MFQKSSEKAKLYTTIGGDTFDEIETEVLEETKLDDLDIPQSQKNVKTMTIELNNQWGNCFEFEYIPEGGISMKIKDYKKLTKDVMRSFMQVFAGKCRDDSYEGLGRLEINFSGWESDEINQGIMELASKMAKMSTLLHFELNIDDKSLGKVGFVTEEAIEGLSTAIGAHLKDLQTLSLNFSGNRRITDKGVSALAAKAFEDHKHITGLKLSFEGCSITDHGLKELASQVSMNLKNVNYVLIQVGQSYVSDKVTQQGRVAAIKILRHVPKLDILV